MPRRSEDFAQIDAHARRDLGDVECVGRVAHSTRLEVRISATCRSVDPAGDRHDHAAEPLGAVMRAEPAGEEAVAIGVVHDVARSRARAGEQRAIRSDQVSMSFLRIADHRRLAGRAGRGVHAHELLARHREHAERIIVAQIRLQRERKFGNVGELLQVGRATPAASNFLRKCATLS